MDDIPKRSTDTFAPRDCLSTLACNGNSRNRRLSSCVMLLIKSVSCPSFFLLHKRKQKKPKQPIISIKKSADEPSTGRYLQVSALAVGQENG